MLGGEHKKERVSERLQNLNNQPRLRGYLPGCHMRACDVDDRASYSVKTLQGNWVEERRDVASYEENPVIPTELNTTWKTTYTHMVAEGTSNAKLKPANKVNQRELVDIVDGRHQCFPGHQPLNDPNFKGAVLSTYNTTTGTAFRDPATIREAEKKYVPPVLGGSLDAQPRAVMLRVRHRLLSIAKGTFGGMRRSLKVMDTSDNSHINDVELQEGLKRYNIPVSNDEIKVLMRYFDRDVTGEICIAAFVRALRGEMSDRRQSLVKKAYKLLDANRNGVVRLEDIHALYDASNHPDVKSGKKTAKECLKSFAAEWDSKSDDVIEFSEFMEYYSDISATIDSEHFFELMMRNTWHISGGEGASHNTSCRRVLVTQTTGRQTVQEIKNDLGIGAECLDKMKANLCAQGITDVAKIELHS